MSNKPAIHFRVSDIPISLPQHVREDLKAIARLGDGDAKKYDSDFDKDDLTKFYESNPVTHNFKVTGTYFRNFNKTDSQDYLELYRKLTEAIYVYGNGTLAQFNIHDPRIPVDYRKFLKDVAGNYYFEGEKDIFEDMDLVTFAEDHNFPFSQLVSLNTFHTPSGYDFDSIFKYLTYIEGGYARGAQTSFEPQLVYSGRLISEKLDIPFLHNYITPEELFNAGYTIPEDLAYTLFDEYSRVASIKVDDDKLKIIAAVNGSTGYHLFEPEETTTNAIPITNTTYLFFLSDKETTPPTPYIYRVKLDLKGTSTIEMLDSAGAFKWSFTFTLSDKKAKENLFTLLQTSFDEAKKSLNFNKHVRAEIKINNQIEETEKQIKNDPSDSVLTGRLKTLKEKKVTIVADKRKTYKDALNQAFSTVLNTLKVSDRLNITHEGTYSEQGISRLQEMLKKLPDVYVPDIYFELMKLQIR